LGLQSDYYQGKYQQRAWYWYLICSNS